MEKCCKNCKFYKSKCIGRDENIYVCTDITMSSYIELDDPFVDKMFIPDEDFYCSNYKAKGDKDE